MPFYKENMRTVRFWYLRGSWKQSPKSHCKDGQKEFSFDYLLLKTFLIFSAAFPLEKKTNKQSTKKGQLRVPTVVQWDQWHLCSTRMQVQSLAWHSGLKDPALSQLQYRWQLKLRSDPWPGNSMPQGSQKRRKEKKRKLS